MRSYLQNLFKDVKTFHIVIFLVAVFIIVMLYYGKHFKNFYYKADNRRKNYVRNIENIRKSVETVSGQDKQKIVEHYMRLVDMYYKGVPDIYDGKGQKIKGVQPDPQKAIMYLNEAIKNGYVKGYLILAKMYHEGFHNFEPQLDKAEEIYRTLLKNHPVENDSFFGLSFNDRMEAEEGLDKLMKERHVNFVTNWLNLPVNQPNRVSGDQREMETFFNADLGGEYDRNQRRDEGFLGRTSIFTLPTANDAVRNIEMKVINKRKLKKDRDRIRRNMDLINVDIVQPTTNPRRNDLQNVHDSTVLSTIKQSIGKLTENTHISRALPQSLHEVRQMLNGLTKSDKKDDALKALDSIERSDTALSFIDLKEVDALNLVWNRIHDPKNKDKQQVLKDNLINELAECIEHDKPVCSTGKFTRMIDTLNIVDKDVTIKPTHLINQEMMDKSAKIRNDMMNGLSDYERKQVESLESNAIQENFYSKLKDTIRSELRKDYVDTGVMTEQKFGGELSKWIDEI